MQDNDRRIPSEDMVDIVSSSPKAKKKSHPVEAYGKGIFKSLGTIIKAIAFLVAFAVLAVFLLAAYLLFTKDALFAAISIGIVITGIVIATIIMFLIFGLGHVICQNNEILKRLNKRDHY